MSTEVFELYDVKGTNSVQATSVGNMLRMLGMVPSEEEVAAHVGDKATISLDEFNKILAVQEAVKCDCALDIESALTIFDKDGGGSLQASELRHIMTNIGDTLDESEFDSMITEVGVSAEGTLDIKKMSAKLAAA